MNQPQGSNSPYFLRPRDANLLPLSPAIQAEPSALALSKLPKPLRKPFKDIIPDTRLDGWTRTIHVYPAAYPRSRDGSSVHNAVLPTYPKSLNVEEISKDIRNRNVTAQMRVEGSQVDEPQLFIAVARYFVESDSGESKNVSADEDDPITLILVHANGLHKETWEPMLAHLLVSPAAKKVQEIWAIDSAQYGDSAILNRSNLGLIVDLADWARDVLNFIFSYLPDQSSSRSTIPTVLPQLECPNSSFFRLDKSSSPPRPQSINWRNRKLGLIGHSMGGTSATLAATSIPEIFHHVILVDPAMAPFENLHLQLPNYVYSAIRRRDQWENADVAFEKFTERRGPLSLWDPQALHRYVKYALETTHLTKLKCNKLHEASCASDAHGHTFQAYHRLFGYYQNGQQPPFNLSLILAKPSQSISKEVPRQQSSLYKDGKEVNFSSWGHLMVQENPADVASFISKSLLKSVSGSSCMVKFNNLPSKL
ncbi:hypothetical protein PGT21_012790 [Puccinia graminis f. sp. tritici]|uniref:AB hydrolase-1 domain-containing protein n=1 Tax=Puccinia graminis f. sp. tritici TaxID=56615 RepID=A0A5B0PJZ7_PUCGR|nr:hypothetical protein PGTUg99_034753 [Puccinia graminis f. sp. tritici]KAA1101243.1 hypothetical protein PGT21_012790 [Puccinia graminis f. sp. tritici]